MASKFGDQSHFNARALHHADPLVPRSVRADVWQPEPVEGLLPNSRAEVLVLEGMADADTLPVLVHPPWPREDAVKLAIQPWAEQPPFEQHGFEHRPHGDFARARFGLRQRRDRAVALLHPSDLDDAAAEADILPQQRQLLAGPRAAEVKE